MSDRTVSVYETPNWGAQIAGTACVRRDAEGALFIDEVRVEAVRLVGLFSVLEGADGRTRVVLTNFLRLVPDPRHSVAGGGDHSATGEAHDQDEI